MDVVTNGEVALLATRELWWNIDAAGSKVIFYSLAAISMGIFLYGLGTKIARISAGKNLKNDARSGNLKNRLLTFLSHSLGQQKIKQKKTPGLAHFMVLFGFLTLWVVTQIVAVQEHLHIGIYFFQGSFYKIVSAAGEIGGVLLFLGVLIFALRRYVFVSKAIDNTQNDWIQIAFLFAFVFSGFALEGLRMVGTNTYESFAPIGLAFAQFFQFMVPEDVESTHQILWWVHSLLTFSFIALTPYTKFVHIFTSPLTMFFRSDRARGELSTPYNLMALMEAEAEGKEMSEEDFMIGVASYTDFSWKTLLDSEACTACARCHVVCPAQNTDKPLSPKNLFLDIKKLAAHEGEIEDVYEFINEDVLWSCTTCNACVEECPVLIEHVDTIVDMRRGLLPQNKVPSNLQATLKNIRTKSNPWGMDPSEREKWIVELKEKNPEAQVKLARENKGNFEYLYWVGSPGAYDTRNIEVTKANVQLFNKAGIDFAILGNEEKSSGDVARRAGDEGLFQELAFENIEIMMQYGVSKVITQCPHVYNTFKNEYSSLGKELGFEIEVYHHSEILAELIKEGTLQPSNTVQATITYHDPCYLARYNSVCDPPRFILESIPGITLQPIEHEKSKSTCCGGGGAQMWFEAPGSYINVMRFEELNEHSPDKIAAACPYCSIMLSTATTNAFPGTNIPEIEDVAITLLKAV